MRAPALLCPRARYGVDHESLDLRVSTFGPDQFGDKRSGVPAKGTSKAPEITFAVTMGVGASDF
eukprot:5567352-Alexandrium_andersonii.AAC.1